MSAFHRVLLGCLFFPLCAGPTHWAKPGIPEQAAAAQYRQCAQQGGKALATDRAIDHDILAARRLDWERAGTLFVEVDQMRRYDAAHARAIVSACMRARGYRPRP